WGVIYGVLTAADVDEMANDVTGGDSSAAKAVIRELLSSQLLFRSRIDGEEVFRTRMAETVRLAVSLRQLFESNARSTKWRTAPRLVGDYRFSVRPRRYPRRDLSTDDVVARVDQGSLRIPAVEDALRRLLTTTAGSAGGYAAFQADAIDRILSTLSG